ncbi:MAG: tRNA adenosine(34) deaminase TadA [Eubacterium sp.]|nr:tRNA adenosine(34) deaminase TadA [Eubacterium sp.]
MNNQNQNPVSSVTEPAQIQPVTEDTPLSEQQNLTAEELSSLKQSRRIADQAAKQRKWEKRQQRKKAQEAEERIADARDAESRQAMHEQYMSEAIAEARKAAAIREVPIGCVIVRDGKIIARGYNRRNTDASTLSHAELNAIRIACRTLGDWRLEGCTMYVTLEPCPMCAGAIVQSRLDEVVIGCMNPKAGCAGSVLNLMQVPQFNHQVKTTKGILETECSEMLTRFFADLRTAKR